MIAPANTGRDNKRSKAVMKTDHTNNGIRSKFILSDRIFRIVDRKLIAPKMEEIPAKCKEKILKSTANPGWAKDAERGG